MSNSPTSLNLSAATLTVLQTRNAAALSAVNSERKIAETVEQASETLAQHAASGTAIPRGQILNILV